MKIRELFFETSRRNQDLSTAIAQALDLGNDDGTPLTATQLAQLPQIRSLLGGKSDKSAIGMINRILFRDFPNRRKARPPHSPELVTAIGQSLDLRKNGRPLTAKQIAELSSVKSLLTGLSDDAAVTKVQNILSDKFPTREKALSFVDRSLIDAIQKVFDSKGPLTRTQLMTIPQIRQLLPADDQRAKNRLRYVLSRPPLRDRQKVIKPITDQEISLAAEQFATGTPLSVISSNLDRDQTGIKRRLQALPHQQYLKELLPAHLSNRAKPPGVSYAEIQFFQFLQDYAGIPPLERNKTIRRAGVKYPYNCDGINEDKKVIVEFYGDRYHANINKYPDDLSQPLPNITAGEIRAKDKIKEDFLKQKGYQLVIVWEKEWSDKKNRLNVVNHVRQAFGLEPLRSLAPSTQTPLSADLA